MRVFQARRRELDRELDHPLRTRADLFHLAYHPERYLFHSRLILLPRELVGT